MAIVIGFIVFGAVARTVLPFLQMLRDNPGTPFDRRFLVPLAVSVVITLIGIPLLFQGIPDELLNLESPTLTQLGALFLIGWGGTDLLREGQKLVTK
ncbi:MAG TPA: hypothetical protein VJG32_17875 [Anaerolineae bacterium]|nr:hypothetical protein [Anaerolineae bacterium]